PSVKDTPAPPEDAFDTGSDTLSQDDIEALLSGGGGKPSVKDTPAPPEDAFEAGSNTLSQDDIEALLAGGGDKPSVKDTPAPPEDAFEAGSNTLSQDDIEALLAGGGEASSPVSQGDNSLSADGDNPDFVGQNEIDALLSDRGEGAPSSVSPSEDFDGGEGGLGVSQDEIDRLLGITPEIAPKGRSDSLSEKSESLPPYETETGSNLISQAYLDALLEAEKREQEKGPEPPPATEPVSKKEKPQGLEPSEDDFILQDDIDKLLAGVDKEATGGDSLESDPLISREDIENLLEDVETGGDGDGGGGEDVLDLISQQDLEKLMQDVGVEEKAPERENVVEPVFEEGKEVLSQEDLDALLQDVEGSSDADISMDFSFPGKSIEESAPSSEPVKPAPAGSLPPEEDRVVLMPPDENNRNKGKAGKKWIMALAAGLAALIIAGGGGVWLLRSPELPTPVGPMAEAPVPVAAEQGEVRDVLSPLPSFISLAVPGFLVPSSPGVAHAAYLVADLSVDLAPEAARRFEAEPARFRDVVYQSLKRIVDASAKTEITEENLQNELMDALNQSFRERVVLRVVFTHFSIG
ncbi:hypothetical protein OOT00_00005, partial [Desulfobotulus sp. H1]